jgi:hypothetical protein
MDPLPLIESIIDKMSMLDLTDIDSLIFMKTEIIDAVRQLTNQQREDLTENPLEFPVAQWTAEYNMKLKLFRTLLVFCNKEIRLRQFT